MAYKTWLSVLCCLGIMCGVAQADTKVNDTGRGVGIVPGGSHLPQLTVDGNVTVGGTGERVQGTDTFVDFNDAGSGTVALGAYGLTFNEDLTFDFDTANANIVDISSSTGGQIRFNKNTGMADDLALFFGSSVADAYMLWETTGNDSLQILTAVGSANASGYVSILELNDINSANRAPLSTTSNPTLRIYSADESAPSDYIEFYHDQSNSQIHSPGALVIDVDYLGFVAFSDNTDQWAYLMNDPAIDQATLGLTPAAGNQFVITGSANIYSDHDHAAPTNPTLFIHSVVDPDVSNNQWGSLAHDQEDFVISSGARVGTGTGATTDEQDIVLAPQGTEKFTVHGVGLFGPCVQDVDISTTGDGNPATATLQPNCSFVRISCADPDSCDITMSETDANSVAYEAGQLLYITEDAGTGAADFSDTGGLSELAGAVSVGQWDVLTLLYEGTTWVQVGLSNN